MLEIIIFWSIQQVALKITSDEGRRFPVSIPRYLRGMKAFKIGFFGGRDVRKIALKIRRMDISEGNDFKQGVTYVTHNVLSINDILLDLDLMVLKMAVRTHYDIWRK